MTVAPPLHAAALLRERGLRATGPRVELLSYILTSDEGHVSADALIERAATADPPVHRATVYRTLEGLTKAGVLRHVHLSVGTIAYRLAEPSPSADPGGDADQLYVQCVVCGRLVALPVSVLSDAVRQVHDRSGFALDPTHVALSGTCPDCAHAGTHRHH